MPKLRGALIVAGFLLCPLARASRADEPAPADARPFTDAFLVETDEWSNVGTNPWFSLEPGHVLTLEGKEDGEDVRLVITVLAETKTLDGVETRVVEERETKGGALAEVSRNYFAMSKRSNSVYYFGEDVDVYEGGKLAGHGGSWHSGEKGSRFGLMMPGTPLLGARYQQETAPGVAMDRAEIVSLSEEVETPAGRFTDGLRIEETTPLEKGSKEYKSYARGVGLLRDGALRLVKAESPKRGVGAPAAPRAPEDAPIPDPLAKPIYAYRAYTDDELRDPAHAVTLEMLLGIVGNADAPKAVRELAAATITADRTITNDPSLAMDGRREHRARVKFSMKVLELLVAADTSTRRLAAGMLESLWVGWRSQPEFRLCDPADLDSCKRSAEAWKRIFAK